MAVETPGVENVPLGEVITLHYGKALPKEDRNPSGLVPVYGANGVKDHSDKSLTKGPALIVGRKGSAGEVTRVEGLFWPLDVTYYTTHDENRIDFGYLEYALSRLDLPSLARGVKPGINRNDVYELEIPLPPLDEQKRIVSILDQAFAALDRARENAEANLADAANLLVETRERLLDTTQSGWSSGKLLGLINIKHGFAFKSEFFAAKGDYVLLTPGNYFEEGGFRHRGDKQKYYVGVVPEGFILEKGDLLMAMTEQAPGLLGSCILVPESERFLHNQRLGLIQPKSKAEWHSPFFAHVFNLRSFRKALSDTCTGIKVRHTSPDKIKSVSVPIPPSVEEQQAIANQLDELTEWTRKLQMFYRRKLTNIADLRQSLLQKAFSGQLT